jgi:hypothetical protein
MTASADKIIVKRTGQMERKCERKKFSQKQAIVKFESNQRRTWLVNGVERVDGVQEFGHGDGLDIVASACVVPFRTRRCCSCRNSRILIIGVHGTIGSWVFRFRLVRGGAGTIGPLSLLVVLLHGHHERESG